jgi:hypothetical protein
MTSRKQYPKSGHRRMRGSTRDVELRYVTTQDPEMERWRALGAEWLAKVPSAKALAMNTLKRFMVDYLIDRNLTKDPVEFFRAGYLAPCFYEVCLTHLTVPADAARTMSMLNRFLDYVLENYFSVEDDIGRRIVPNEYCSPLPLIGAKAVQQTGGRHESDKNVLPYIFIKELRELLCPGSAKCFSDWSWAHAAYESGGDWFRVSQSVIDKNDPNCVWRIRQLSINGRKKPVYEMWYPGRAVALLTKLELPVRTYQVRMLDSGEADTWVYKNETWLKNTSPLRLGESKHPYRQGVFRKMVDSFKNVVMTGLFLNTNKTGDVDKDVSERGYVVPWEHHNVIYWLSKLRDWQEKYNPIDSPMPWSKLTAKHFGVVKPEATLRAMGVCCFLFRDATASGEERHKPIPENCLTLLWYKLLKTFEEQCERNKRYGPGGIPLRFIARDTIATTLYPLHSLRVSLITAYALEGGVSMPILSKCIAGHSRLVMTLYYTKAGVAYVSEHMAEAEKRMQNAEQANFSRWLKDATYREIENNGVYTDPVAIQAVLSAQSSGASFVMDSKGICPKGGAGCDSGGVYVNDDTGKISFGPIQGFPEKNCVRCRWFISGPAFLTGLASHWNMVHFNMSELGSKVIALENKVTVLEDEQFIAQSNDQPFLSAGELVALQKSLQAAIEHNDKLANDSTATLRLIARCRSIVDSSKSAEGVQLVAVGNISDVGIAINECGKLQQVLAVLSGSSVFPENDLAPIALKAGKSFDMMLALNKKTPVFFCLEDDELLAAVQHMTELLRAETGSIENAVPYVEGSKRLKELGVASDVDQLINALAATNTAAIRFSNITKRLPRC